MYTLLLIVICLLFLLLFVTLFYLIKILNDKKSNSLEIELQSKLDAVNNENEHLRSILKERIQEVNDLRNLIPNSTPTGENISSENRSSIQNGQNLNPEINIHDIKSSSIISQYFTVPSSNGTFNPLHAKDFDDGNCYYKVEYSGNLNSIGKLYYITSNRDKIAIHAYNDYLTKVCEILNFSDRNIAHNIQMISTGTVNLIGDLWTIDLDNKVKIKFI